MKKVILMIVLMLLAINTANADTSTDLVGCWDFENVLTDSVGSMDFTASGTAIYNSSDAKIGSYSLEVDDDKYSAIQDEITSTPFTLNYWVELDRQGGNNELVGIWDGSSWFKTIQHVVVDSLITRVWDPLYSVHGETIFNIDTGDWHFLSIVVYNDTDVEWYVDGVSTLNTTETMTFSSEFDELFIGKGDGMDGRIDGMTLYDTDLSGSVIAELYNSNNGLTCIETVSGSSCTVSLTNTSWSAYTNTSCDGSNYNYSRYLTEYDSNDCGTYTNVTYWDNGTTSCSIGSNPQFIGINTTFDLPVQAADHSTYAHSFSLEDSAAFETNTSVCKWYGCLDMTEGSGALQTDSLEFNLSSNGFGWEYWYFSENTPSSSDKPGFVWVKDTDGYPYGDIILSGTNNEGWAVSLHNTSGDKFTNFYSYANPASGGIWHYQAFYYNSSSCDWHFFLDGNAVTRNECVDNIDLNTEGAVMEIGRSRYWAGGVGYMDEFIFYADSENLSSSYFQSQYDEKRLGTPPDLDLYVVSANWTKPLNFSDEFNQISFPVNVSVNITIKNEGVTNNSGSFNNSFYMNGSEVCSWISDGLDAGESESHVCHYYATYPVLVAGNVTVDVDNDIDETLYTQGDETNNYDVVLMDLRNHPFMQFNGGQSEMSAILTAASTDDGLLGENYDWHRMSSLGAWNPSYDSVDVDPYGKKAYDYAVRCVTHDYDPSDTGCVEAYNHVRGWLQDGFDYSDVSVQASHQIHYVAWAFDLLAPNMTETEYYNLSKRLSQSCNEIFGKNNVRPDLDGANVNIGNGQGFSSGFAMACEASLGNKNNPNNEFQSTEDYQTTNMNDAWNRRAYQFAAGYKGNDKTDYPEGFSYTNYAFYHFLPHMLNNYLAEEDGWAHTYNNVACSYVMETAYNLLDCDYNGNALRGDNSMSCRYPSFGDSHSYDAYAEEYSAGYGTLSIASRICENETIKNLGYTVRNQVYEKETSSSYNERNPTDLFNYYYLMSEATNMSDIQSSVGGFKFDKSYDRYTLRKGFARTNDSVFIFDAGDEASSGHPEAEFKSFVYVLGEPFLDFWQVNHDDDGKTERFANTVSYSNSTATGYITTGCSGSTILNQYYGIGGCDDPLMSSYPNFNYMPDLYRGDVVEYWGDGGEFRGGLRSYKPYSGSDAPPVQKFLIYDDVILQRYEIDRSISGYVQFNFQNIIDEFTPTIVGTNLSFERVGTSKNYEIEVIETSNSLSLEGGNTSIQASNVKSGGANLDVYYGHYRYYNTNTDTINTTFLHHWYEGTDDADIDVLSVSGAVGVNRSGTIMLLDTSGEGISYGGLETDAWGMMILNDTHVALNGASWLYNGTDNTSVSSDGIFAASGTVDGGEDPGDETDTTSPIITSVSAGSVGLTTARALFTTDEPANATVYFVNVDNNSDNGTSTQLTFTTSHSILMSGLTPNSTYNFSLTSVCDVNGNCNSSYAHPFTTLSPSDVVLESDDLLKTLTGLVIVIFLLSFLVVLAIFLNDGDGLKDPKKVISIIVLIVFVLLGAAIISMLI